MPHRSKGCGGAATWGASEGDAREPWQALGEACPGGGTCLNRGPEEWVCLAVGGQLVGGVSLGPSAWSRGTGSGSGEKGGGRAVRDPDLMGLWRQPRGQVG